MVTALFLICAVANAGSALPPGPKPVDPGHRRCGHTERFDHRFPIEAQGVTCAEARSLVGRPCTVSLKRQWSCTSFREDGPFIAWFPTEDLFKRRQYPAVLLRRYPCAQARVTPQLFSIFTKGFPTRRQLLADDVLRCGLIRPGDSSLEVEETIGPADEKEPGGGRLSYVYGLGLERDSIIQIDPELLVIEVDKGRVTSISIVQGG